VLSAPYEDWTYGTTISIPTVLGTGTFTLGATFGVTTYNRTASVVAGARIFYGAAPIPGAYDEAFVLGLGANSLQTSIGIVAPMDTGASDYGWVWIPTAFGTSPTWYVYPQGGSPQYPGSVIFVQDIDVTFNGVVVPGGLYRTFNNGQGPINMKAA
jgi:hypothetical protein